MGEFALGQPVPRFEDPRLLRGGGYGALSTDPDTGLLYGLNVGSGSPPPTHLVTINPVTGAVTALGASLASLDAIAFRIVIPEPSGVALLAIAAIALRTRRFSNR